MRSCSCRIQASKAPAESMVPRTATMLANRPTTRSNRGSGLPNGSIGTVTLFLGDVRVSTNVRLFQDRRAIGTRVSAAVRDAVLDHGRTWLDSAFVVNDWYVSGYEPIYDSYGDRIGMLYAGFL